MSSDERDPVSTHNTAQSSTRLTHALTSFSLTATGHRGPRHAARGVARQAHAGRGAHETRAAVEHTLPRTQNTVAYDYHYEARSRAMTRGRAHTPHARTASHRARKRYLSVSSLRRTHRAPGTRPRTHAAITLSRSRCRAACTRRTHRPPPPRLCTSGARARPRRSRHALVAAGRFVIRP